MRRIWDICLMGLSTSDKLIFLLTGVVVLASAGDIVSDLSHGSPMGHVMQEVVLMVLAAPLMMRMILDLRQQRRQLEGLKRELAQPGDPAKPVNPLLETARKRLSEAVKAQFQDWQLSPGEGEIGMLLLKGLSIKEIAVLRETHEKTVRQQASAIYRKAGVSGRHAFAAWFIEDLL
jgi:DNA-binding CsgD family transcriptional regulator